MPGISNIEVRNRSALLFFNIISRIPSFEVLRFIILRFCGSHLYRSIRAFPHLSVPLILLL